LRKYLLVFLAVLIAALALTPVHAEEEERGILVVSGTGTLSISPDIAEIYMGVTTENRSAWEALQENSKKMNEVISRLRSAGAEVETSRFSIYPVYSYKNHEGEPVLKGYRVTHTIRVRTDVESAGKLIDLAVSSGVNNVQSISFTSSQLEEKRKEALKLAVKDAKEKAETISEAAGVQIVGIKEISSSSFSYPVYRYDLSPIADAGTPVTPGELQITASVTISYWIA